MFISGGVEAPGSSEKWRSGQPITNLFALQTVSGVAEVKNEDQCSLLAFLMAWKYAVLAALAEARRAALNRSGLEERSAQL